MPSTTRYAIGDLARLAGVSRRTVRYYVQEALIPPPFGVGRGNHYGTGHLEQLLRVKAQQEAGRTLDEIRRAPEPAPPRRATRRAAGDHEAVARSLWRRLTLVPGVELHVAGGVRLPSAARLQELAAWCRQHLVSTADEESEKDDAE